MKTIKDIEKEFDELNNGHFGYGVDAENIKQFISSQIKEFLKSIVPEEIPSENKEWIDMVMNAFDAGFSKIKNPEEWYDGNKYGHNSCRQEILTRIKKIIE